MSSELESAIKMASSGLMKDSRREGRAGAGRAVVAFHGDPPVLLRDHKHLRGQEFRRIRPGARQHAQTDHRSRSQQHDTDFICDFHPACPPDSSDPVGAASHRAISAAPEADAARRVLPVRRKTARDRTHPDSSAPTGGSAPFIIPTICFTGIIRTGPPSSFPFPPRPISSPPFWTGPMFCTWTMKPWIPASNGL